MKKNLIPKIAAGTALFLFLFSCKSAPQAEMSSPADDEAAYENAKAETETQRKLAMDFGGPEYFPDEFNAAEALYTAAGAKDPADAAGRREAIQGYGSAAEGYRSVSDRAIPRYFEGKTAETETARGEAVAAGAETYALEHLAAADESAAEAKRLYDAQDYAAAGEAAERALKSYGYLRSYSQAMAEKADIDANQLAKYDRENYRLGNENAAKAQEAFSAADYDGAAAAADEALARYRLISSTGWKALASDLEKAARNERARGLRIKAEVASKNDWDEAQGLYDQGAQAVKAEEYKTACGAYSQAETRFASVYRDVLQKRRSADSLIKNADKKITESGELARAVQEELSGGVR